MKKTVLLASCITTLAFMFGSCGSKNDSSNLQIDLGGENRNLNIHTLIRDTTNSLNSFSRVDSVNQFGFGWEGYLSESFQNKKVKVVVSGRMRTTEDLKGGLVVGITTNGENKFYASFSAEKYITDLNKWCEFKDSLTIEANATSALPMQFSTYLYKPDGKGFLDMDDVSCKIEVLE